MVKPLRPRPPRKPFKFGPGGPLLNYSIGTPMNETPVSEISVVYNRVCSNRIAQERFDTGNTATLQMWDTTGWIVKSDLPSYTWGTLPPVKHEYGIYEQLSSEGLMGRITPKCLLEEGVFGYPDSIVLRLINYAATLEEYAQEMIEGRMSKQLWVDLCSAVGKILFTFHQHDFVHGDLHAKNVVIGINKGEWNPYLIDFGSSYHPNADYFPNEGLLPDWDELVPEADLKYLLSELRLLDEGENYDYEAGLIALEDAALDS